MVEHPPDHTPADADMGSPSATWRPIILVVPCFNERRRLDMGAILSFTRCSDRLGFLFVDDGSTDGTGDLIQQHTGDEWGPFRYLRLEENEGKGEAVRRGMAEALKCNPGIVGFWDADLSTPLEEISPMVEILEGKPALQAVLASRVQLLGRTMDRKPARHYLGRVFATGASLTLGMPVYDTQCGAKVFRGTPILRAVLEHPFSSRWIFDVELIARLSRAFGTTELDWIEEYPLRRWTDVAGSKLRILDFLWAARDLARIWWGRRMGSADG